MQAKRFHEEREIKDVIQAVMPWQDTFEDDPEFIEEENEPTPLDFEDDGFERGYN